MFSASFPKARGDALGWAGPDPRLDPFGTTRNASHSPVPEEPISCRRLSGSSVISHHTLGIGGGRPWATLAVPILKQQLPPLPPQTPDQNAGQRTPAYLLPAAAVGLYPSLPGPLRSLTKEVHQPAKFAASQGRGKAASGASRGEGKTILIPPEKAHLERIARLEARMASKVRPKSAASAAAAAKRGESTASLYSQDLVRNQVDLASLASACICFFLNQLHLMYSLKQASILLDFLSAAAGCQIALGTG